MAFDYPDNPASGNEFAPGPGLPTYVWDSVAWRRKGASAATPPPPTQGVVVTDASMTGDGSAASPLSVAMVDGGAA